MFWLLRHNCINSCPYSRCNQLYLVGIKDGNTVRYVGTVRLNFCQELRYAGTVRWYDTLQRLNWSTVRWYGMPLLWWYGYGTLVWHSTKIGLKYGTLVRYGSRCEIRSTQILNVLYRTAILANNTQALWKSVEVHICSSKVIMSMSNVHVSKLRFTKAQVRSSAIVTGEPKGAVPPLTTACAPPFRFTQNRFLEHHVTTRQQTIMEKGLMTFEHISRLKLSRFFAKLLATKCCTYMWRNKIIRLINTPLRMCRRMRM